VRDLVIYGASFLDSVKLVDAINRVKPTWRIAGFLDDATALRGKRVLGYPVLGGKERLAALARGRRTEFFNNVRSTWQVCERIARRLRAAGRESVSLIHPSVNLDYVEHGPGCILADGCVVAAMTRLGAYVSARVGCTISHDVRIGDFALLGPGATLGSHVHIGARALVGAGATVLPGISVGPRATIGAGSVVTRRVAARARVAGVPARPLSAARRR